MKELKSISIHGREYIQVNERIGYFRTAEEYKGWALVSEILHHGDGRILIRANIINSDGVLVATGLAEEKEGSSNINKTSYVENCETSAWGRALGNLGIGIDTSIATYEEVANAIKQQGEGDKEFDEVKERLIDSFKVLSGITGSNEKAHKLIGTTKASLSDLVKSNDKEKLEKLISAINGKVDELAEEK